MSAGTLKLTNGSTAVTGTGTTFTVDLTAADFVIVTVGGTTYSLAVDTVTNATTLVLSAPFTGPTTASVSWQAVPRKAMLRVTAELNKQVTEALRLGNENAMNWQAVLSANDTATVVLPDGTTLTGLSWKKLSEIMGSLDINALTPLAAQIHTDAAQVAADKPVIVQAKTDAVAAKNAAAGSQTAAAGSATAAAGSATTSTQQADRAKTEADRAQSANPDNQLKKANNLGDVSSTATARTNLEVLYQRRTVLGPNEDLNSFTGPASGAGEYYQNVNTSATPANNYPVQLAGSLKVYITGAGSSAGCIQEYRVWNGARIFIRNFTGSRWSSWIEIITAGDPASARKLIGVDRVKQYAGSTSMSSADGLKDFTFTDAGEWGVWVSGTNTRIPLPVLSGGTGAINASGARDNLNAMVGSVAMPVTPGANLLSFIAAQAQSGKYTCDDTVTQLPAASVSEGFWFIDFNCRTKNASGVAISGLLTITGGTTGRKWKRRLLSAGAWTNWTEDGVFVDSGTALTAADDLNSFDGYRTGEYYNGLNANATGANNYPTGEAGSLKVYNTTRAAIAGGKMACVQEYRTYASNRLFMRCMDNAGVWSSWVEFLSTKTVATVVNGGTGSTTAAGARTNLEVVYQRDSSIGPGENLNSYNSSMAGEFRCATDANATPANNYPIQQAGSLKVYKTLTGSAALSCVQEYRSYQSNRLFMRRLQMPGDSWSAWAEFYSTANTTVDSNGFIKKASPIIKVFGDGKCETNDESEGVTVNRVSEGVYHITECLGLNSDLAWGGVAGGIEVPKDINGQPQIWVDYDVESDGSITLKTYHREHANAPEFARNIVDGYSDGSPRDIPVGVFVSLRVEMSSDSKYNIAIRKAEIAMKVKNYIDNNNAELAAMPMMLK